MRKLILGHLAEVEPLLHRDVHARDNPSQPIDAVVAELGSTASRPGEALPRPTR
jgi:hypothetical protein